MKRLLLFLLLLCTPLTAELRFKQIGKAVVSESGVLSCWLVEGGAPSPAVAIKLVNVGKAGETNVVLDAAGLKQLKQLSQQAVADKSKLTKGQIVLVGSIPSGENKIDVVVLRPDVSVVKALVAHEGEKEATFTLIPATQRELAKLLDKALQSFP